MLHSSDCLIDVEVAVGVVGECLRRLGPIEDLDVDALTLEISMALSDAARRPIAVHGIRPLISVDAADVRDQRPDLDDAQVATVLNADLGDLADTPAVSVVRERILELAERLFPAAAPFSAP